MSRIDRIRESVPVTSKISLEVALRIETAPLAPTTKDRRPRLGNLDLRPARLIRIIDTQTAIAESSKGVTNDQESIANKPQPARKLPDEILARIIAPKVEFQAGLNTVLTEPIEDRHDKLADNPPKVAKLVTVESDGSGGFKMKEGPAEPENIAQRLNGTVSKLADLAVELHEQERKVALRSHFIYSWTD